MKHPRVWTALLLAACSGSIGESTSPPDRTDPTKPSASLPTAGAPPTTDGTPPGPVVSPAPDGTQMSSTSLFQCGAPGRGASPSRIWRLSAVQYDRTVAALLPNFNPSYANPFQGAVSGERFETYAAPFGMPAALADQVMRANREVALQLQPRLATTYPCLASADAACVKTVFTQIGARAFRRPLSPDEVDRFTALVTANQAPLGIAGAVVLGVQALLNSPHFLFRLEVGDGKMDSAGRSRLRPFEIASALSYTLKNTPPDPALMQAAETGQLSTPDQIRQQVLRLLGEPAGNDQLLEFFRQYTRYENAAQVFKDKTGFPNFPQADLVGDTDAWVKDLLTRRTDFLNHLLTSGWGYTRAKTAPVYGATVTGATPQRVDFPAGQRGGLLTQPSFLVAFSEPDHNDPIRRGKFIAQSLLCLGLPDTPPENVPPLPATPNTTLRERLAVHVNAAPGCRACHDIMDPLGLGLESYDHFGRFRTMEGTKPVDARGVLMGTGNADGPFNGAIELGQRLASSPAVAQCFVRHQFRYWFGRGETQVDGCALKAAFEGMRAAKDDPVEVVTALLSSDSFLYRTP